MGPHPPSATQPLAAGCGGVGAGCAPYRLRMMTVPQIMTGIILAHLPRVCTGNETCLSASYWQNVATTLDTDTAA